MPMSSSEGGRRIAEIRHCRRSARSARLPSHAHLLSRHGPLPGPGMLAWAARHLLQTPVPHIRSLLPVLLGWAALVSRRPG